METHGTGDLEVSTVGVGCNNFGWKLTDDEALQVVEIAISNR